MERYVTAALAFVVFVVVVFVDLLVFVLPLAIVAWLIVWLTGAGG